MNKGILLTSMTLAFVAGFLCHKVMFANDAVVVPIPKSIIYKISEKHVPHYPDELTNALVFKNELEKSNGKFDFVYNNNFWKRSIRVLRHDSDDYEVLSLPEMPMKGNYYLISSDSIFWLFPIRIIRKYSQ